MGEADGIREIAVGTVKLIRRSKTREAWRDSQSRKKGLILRMLT